MNLGELLKNSRVKQGLSFQDVVDRTDYNLSSLKKYERAGDTNGVFPPMDKLTRLCALYEIDPREVFAVCADEDIDTSIFFSLDDRENTPQAVSQTMAQTNSVLRRYGFSELKSEDMIIDHDNHSILDINGEAALRSIETAVHELGVQARCLPKIIEDARELLSTVEATTLLELGEKYGCATIEYLDDFVEVNPVSDQELKQRDRWCDAFAEVLIAHTVYGWFLQYLDQASKLKLAKRLSIEGCYPMEGEEASFVLAKALNDAIINRRPQLLYDENQYSWTVALHHLSYSEPLGLITYEQLQVHTGETRRLYNRLGVSINQINKKNPGEDLPSSPGSYPIQTHVEKENDDGQSSD